jgi:uncharacterized membrane protein (DUF106 family)
MGLFDPFFSIFDTIFYPVFNLLPDPRVSYMVGVFFVSIFIALITTLATSKFVDPEEMKSNKATLKAFQEKINKAREKGDEKKIKKFTNEMMGVQSEVMKGSFKPLMYTMPPIIIVFQWLHHYWDYYWSLQTFITDVPNYLISLPFSLPKYGTELGWLGWYIICSFMTSTAIRKIFKVQM